MTSDNTVYTKQGARGTGQWSASVSGDGDSRVITLTPGVEYIIGRANDVDICLKDAESSRRHARLFFGDGVWWVEDLNSTNGVAIGDRRISCEKVNHGDVIKIVGVRIVLQMVHGNTTGRKEKKAGLGKSKTRRPVVAVVCMSLLVGLAGFAAMFVFLSKDQQVEEPYPVAAREEHSGQQQGFSGGQNAGLEAEPVIEKMPEAELTKEAQRSRELYRLGLLFYDNGNLPKAIEYWDSALTYDDGNNLILQKLARATKELELEIAQHIKQANSHLKYQRHYQAEQEFSIILGLIDDPYDARYQQALSKLKQIKLR